MPGFAHKTTEHGLQIYWGVDGTTLGPVGPKAASLHHWPAAPRALLHTPAQGLAKLLGGPCLIVLGTTPTTSPHAAAPALFIATLLHGDEHSGWTAVQQLLADLEAGRVNARRPIILLLANLHAAAQNQRFVAGQKDYNRIWNPHAGQAACAEEHWASEVLQALPQLSPTGLFAVLDVHNNSGRNPCYACVAALRPKDLQLARLFSRHVIHFENPSTTLGVAGSKLAPTVTLEAGPSLCPEGIVKLGEVFRSALTMHDLPEQTLPPHELDLYRMACIWGLNTDWHLDIRPLEHLSSGEQRPDPKTVWLRGDIDAFNFVELTSPTLVARIAPLDPGSSIPREAMHPEGQGLGVFWLKRHETAPHPAAHATASVPEALLFRADGHVFLAPGFIPSMLTPKPAAIRADCIGYLMERLPKP